MSLSVGIDLGTTNSAISLKKISVEILRNSEGEEFTPSVVARIPESGGYTTKVGNAAKQVQKQFPTDTIVSVKRIMGRERTHPAIQNLDLVHQFTQVEDQDESIQLKLGDLELTPEQVSAEILKKLCVDASAQTNATIESAVITVPAYFTDIQKQATQQAAELAGIKLLRLLPEPTAAAISFGMQELAGDKSLTFLVFDLGGGTFDLSLITMANQQFMEITKGGDMWLGGDDIDSDIVNFVLKEKAKELGKENLDAELAALSDSERSRFMIELREASETAKIALSSEDSTNIDVFGVLKDLQGNLLDIDIDFSREKFEEIISPRINKLSELTKSLLQEVRFDASLVDKVLLVGGTSQIPAVRKSLEKLFGEEKVSLHPRPMTAVAEGAAQLAAELTNSDESDATGLDILHTAAHNYYMKLANGQTLLLAQKDFPLPLTIEKEFEFANKGQSVACINIYNEVHGLLEQSGQAWFDVNHQQDIFADRIQNPDQQVSIVLRFHVDRDNIITLEVYNKSNPDQVWTEKLARTSSQQILLQELEQSLSRAIQSGGDKDLIILSRVVRDTIDTLADADPGSRSEIQRLARNQMYTLSQLASRTDHPLGVVLFHMAIVRFAKCTFSKEDFDKLETLVQDLKTELRTLTDADKIEKLLRELKDSIDSDHPSMLISSAQNLALCYEAEGQPSRARAIRQKMHDYAMAVSNKDQHKIDRLEQELAEETSYLTAMPDQHAFDRDLRLSE